MKKRLLVGIVSVVVLAALALSGPALDVRAGLFDSPPPGGPENDHFANAFVIGELPFIHYVDLTTASLEDGEPRPQCAPDDSWSQSVWYVYIPSESGWLTVYGDAWSSAVAAYTGDSLPGVVQVGSGCWTERLTFWAEAGTTYHFQMGDMYGTGSWRTFYLEGPPPNDDLVNAAEVSGLPYSQDMDNSTASLEPGEPKPSCTDPNVWGKSVWYAFTPEENASITARLDYYYFDPVMAAYTGSSLADLQEVACSLWGNRLTFQAVTGTTYYFQVGAIWNDGGRFGFYLEATPPPLADFWFNPSDPSVFDTVWFYNYSWDPGGMSIESCEWDFGDGTTSADCWSANHLYTSDGDYTIQLAVTTPDGRAASTSRDVAVRTRDVAITKLLAPSAARAGQTRSIVVGVNSKRYPERVRVELQKSVPGGYEWVGSLVQSVPVRPANRTTDFSFSYTFTSADAQVGKVTFRAVAYLESGRDALPADNEAIAPPTKVSR